MQAPVILTSSMHQAQNAMIQCPYSTLLVLCETASIQGRRELNFLCETPASREQTVNQSWITRITNQIIPSPRLTILIPRKHALTQKRMEKDNSIPDSRCSEPPYQRKNLPKEKKKAGTMNWIVQISVYTVTKRRQLWTKETKEIYFHTKEMGKCWVISVRMYAKELGS